MIVEIYSLADITNTNIQRNVRPPESSISLEEWNFRRNQQRNWDTVIQLLGLRFQPMDITTPVKLEKQRPAAFGFGWAYGPVDNVNIWKFRCRYEQEVDLWLIRSDFNHIPIITGLNESIKFPHSCFSSVQDNVNIILTKLD